MFAAVCQWTVLGQLVSQAMTQVALKVCKDSLQALDDYSVSYALKVLLFLLRISALQDACSHVGLLFTNEEWTIFARDVLYTSTTHAGLVIDATDLAKVAWATTVMFARDFHMSISLTN